MFIVIDNQTGKARVANIQEQLAYQEEFAGVWLDLQREDLLSRIVELRAKIKQTSAEFSDVSNYTVLELADVVMEHEYDLLHQG